MWIILLSYSLYVGASPAGLNGIAAAGFVVWLAGLAVESVADAQKRSFNGRAENRGRWIGTGLWRWSRHPNYFGEILVWTGVYVFTLSSLSGLEAAIGPISPAYIFVLLAFITGIPKLEKAADAKWGDDARYRDYKAETSLLVPWPGRRWSRPDRDSRP